MFNLGEVSLYSWFVQLEDWQWEAEEEPPALLLEDLGDTLSQAIDAPAALPADEPEQQAPPAPRPLPAAAAKPAPAAAPRPTPAAVVRSAADAGVLQPPTDAKGHWVLASTRTVWFTSWMHNPAAALLRHAGLEEGVHGDRERSESRQRATRAPPPRPPLGALPAGNSLNFTPAPAWASMQPSIPPAPQANEPGPDHERTRQRR
jgi:hypothetical protein